ncbi:MAG TPA: ABC transporter ATP-binding protein [Pyrinomonadaceae bacterium]|nr:ABC transporter ATP-binding protein [Pyrinomonadaceae bacterium]
MSNIQSPKSVNGTPEASSVQVATADFGLWTLDFGLEVADLRKSFISAAGERIEVLRGASFSASAGEAVAIMGASGAGKSTLLHLLGGLEATDHGTIIAGEFAIDRAGPAELARFRNERVGFVFQFHHLLPDLSAAENVSLPLRIARISHREAMRQAVQLLEEVGLDRRVADSLVGHLSGGEQQRVAVCRALITRPALVLADEPTGNLDTATGDEVARAIVSYARKRRALVVIATHNLALAEVCDRTLVLSNGRLRQS